MKGYITTTQLVRILTDLLMLFMLLSFFLLKLIPCGKYAVNRLVDIIKYLFYNITLFFRAKHLFFKT